MIKPQATRKIAIKVSTDRWGWELYCENHAPKHDTEIVNIDDYARMEEDNTRLYGCLCCPGDHSNFLVASDDEEDGRDA